MTSREYVQWFEHVTAAFPVVHRLFDGGAEAKRRSQQWFAALAKVNVAHATAAIDAMLRGEVDPPKYDWAELPAYVIRYCVDQHNAESAQVRDEYYSGPTVRCLHCQDSHSGFVVIWNPMFIAECDEELVRCRSLFDVENVYREWRRQTACLAKYRTLAVICCCNSPAAVKKRENPQTAIFNPKRNLKAGPLVALQSYLSDTSRLEWSPNY